MDTALAQIRGMELCIVIVCAFATLLNNLFCSIIGYHRLSSLIIIMNANNARHFSECFMCIDLSLLHSNTKH